MKAHGRRKWRTGHDIINASPLKISIMFSPDTFYDWMQYLGRKIKVYWKLLISFINILQ